MVCERMSYDSTPGNRIRYAGIHAAKMKTQTSRNSLRSPILSMHRAIFLLPAPKCSRGKTEKRNRLTAVHTQKHITNGRSTLEGARPKSCSFVIGPITV